MADCNNDLFCDVCGELGKVHQYGGQFFVACDRRGRYCCQSHKADTEAEAIAAWSRLQERPELEATPYLLRTCCPGCYRMVNPKGDSVEVDGFYYHLECVAGREMAA